MHYHNEKTVEELVSAESERNAARKEIEDAEAKARAEKEAEEKKKLESEKNEGVRVAVLDKEGNFKIKDKDE